MNLINTLRMYAEDMHSATGYNECSSSMSKAADMIEKFENMSACEACATIPSVMEYVQQLEQECGTLEKLRNGLENCRLFAARNRKEDWALLILGFCADAGVVGSVTR